MYIATSFTLSTMLGNRLMSDVLKKLSSRKGWLFGGWFVLLMAAVIARVIDLPAWVQQVALLLVALTFPLAIVLAWTKDDTQSPQDAGETRDEEPEQAMLQPADKRTEAAPTASADDTTLPPSFSIAVLAFNNMSDDRELDWVADGLSEDIITKLGKASILNVAARNSSFVWKGTSPDIREVGRELNVRFVVEGSIRVVGQTLRLNAQLIDTLTGAHIWAEIYDLPRDNPDAALHGVEDVVAGELLAVLRDVEIDRLLKLDDAALTVDDIVALCWGKAVVTSTAEGT